MSASGLLMDGALVDVPGVVVRPPASHGGPADVAVVHVGERNQTLGHTSPGGPAHNVLAPGDYRPRASDAWIHQIVVHTTKGIWPQPIRAGKGSGGEGATVADYWRQDPAYSAAAIVVDTAGVVDCLCDLVRAAPWHAEASSPWSIGIEMYQLPGGYVYEATIRSAALVVDAIAARLGIPQWYPRGPYRGAPLRRIETGTGAARRQTGGPDVLGCIGHRDNTERRGRGDPGDAIFGALAGLGWVGVDYDGREDLEAGKVYQRALNARDAKAGNKTAPLVVDGVLGPASVRALRRLLGPAARWRDVG